VEKKGTNSTGFNRCYKHLHYNIIRKLRQNQIPLNEHQRIKHQFKDSMKLLRLSLQKISDNITNKKVWQIVRKKDNNINDIMYMNNEITTLQVNCINKTRRERPHLCNIMTNLFDTYKSCLTLTLYDLIDISKNNIQLCSYIDYNNKLVIVGNIDTIKYKKLLIQINKYFDVNLPNSSYLISHDNRFKELNKLLEQIKMSCHEFIIGRTDKTRKVLIVDSKYYYKEMNKHLEKKFIYLGLINDEKVKLEVDVFIDNDKVKLPNCCLLFKDHKNSVIITNEDLWFKWADNIPTRLIITYPHKMSSEWSCILHDICIKMFKGFKELLNKEKSYLKLLMLKDSFELYDYLNDIVENESNDEILFDSLKYTYDVVEMYDNLQHIDIKRLIDKIKMKYKIINEVERLILHKHIETLFLRVGDRIFRQIKGLPMGSSISPIMSMILIFDLCIENEIKNIVLYIDDFKLLWSQKEDVEKFRYLLKRELNLDIVVNNNDGSMLELKMDEWNIFYYDIDKQRRHINNNKISIPNYNSCDNTITNTNINVIKGYIKKIRKMSNLPKYFYNNNISLMYRCFNSGQLMNYVMSRNNRLIKVRKHRYQLNYRDVGQMNKEIKVQLREDKCLNDKKKISLLIDKLVSILRDF
jgi:hypothetical protein